MATTAYDSKADVAHTEDKDLEFGKKGEVQVEDAVAAEFIDPTVTISPEENLRLKKLIYKK